MFYTPNREDYVQTQDMMAGMKQEIIFGIFNFKLTALTPYELAKRQDNYTPLIISINYSQNGQYFAFIDYCIFTVDS